MSPFGERFAQSPPKTVLTSLDVHGSPLQLNFEESYCELHSDIFCIARLFSGVWQS